MGEPRGTGHRRTIASFFGSAATWIARWTGSHLAMFVGAGAVVIGLFTLGVEITNIAISIVTLLMLFILQNTQNRDSLALHLKLDDLITGLTGPDDELAGAEKRSEEELSELEKVARVPGNGNRTGMRTG